MEVAEQSRNNRTYFMDDTMRTLQLMAMATAPSPAGE